MLGVREDVARQAWVVLWKPDGKPVMQVCFRAFGFSGSLEQARGKVERALVEGVKVLNLSADDFYAKFRDGSFHFHRVQDGLRVQPRDFKHALELKQRPRAGWKILWGTR